jgi:hypothetical protein
MYKNDYDFEATCENRMGTPMPQTGENRMEIPNGTNLSHGTMADARMNNPSSSSASVRVESEDNFFIAA